MLNTFISLLHSRYINRKCFSESQTKKKLFGIQNYIKRQTKLYYCTLKTDVKIDCKTFDTMSEILKNTDTVRGLVFILRTYS